MYGFGTLVNTSAYFVGVLVLGEGGGLFEWVYII